MFYAMQNIIWANYHNSLSWIKAIKGDDSNTLVDSIPYIWRNKYKSISECISIYNYDATSYAIRRTCKQFYQTHVHVGLYIYINHLAIPIIVLSHHSTYLSNMPRHQITNEYHKMNYWHVSQMDIFQNNIPQLYNYHNLSHIICN